MDHLSATHKYNEIITQIWANVYPDAIKKQSAPTIQLLPPCFCVPRQNPDICVVGMNPSHSLKYLGEEKASEMESLLELTDETKTTLMESQSEAHNNHPYFQAIKRFLNEIDNSLRASFCDLYPIRHTSQSELMAFLDNSNSEELVNQLNAATEELFLETDSKLVVICNAEASRRFRKIMSSHLTSTDCKARDRLENKNGTIEVFYASMLSGQRAMDEFSRARLESTIREHWEACNR